MKLVSKTAEYKVYQKRSSRYAVRAADDSYVNGDDKARILLDLGLISAAPAAKEAPAAADGAAAAADGETAAADGEAAAADKDPAGDAES
jgi:hypothetical protein